MNHRTAVLSALAVAALMLVACGQKGPLYLPEEADTTPPADTSPQGGAETAEPPPEPSSGDTTPGE